MFNYIIHNCGSHCKSDATDSTLDSSYFLSSSWNVTVKELSKSLSTFAKVIVKIKVAPLSTTHNVRGDRCASSVLVVPRKHVLSTDRLDQVSLDVHDSMQSDRSANISMQSRSQLSSS